MTLKFKQLIVDPLFNYYITENSKFDGINLFNVIENSKPTLIKEFPISPSGLNTSNIWNYSKSRKRKINLTTRSKIHLVNISHFCLVTKKQDDFCVYSFDFEKKKLSEFVWLDNSNLFTCFVVCKSQEFVYIGNNQGEIVKFNFIQSKVIKNFKLLDNGVTSIYTQKSDSVLLILEENTYNIQIFDVDNGMNVLQKIENTGILQTPSTVINFNDINFLITCANDCTINIHKNVNPAGFFYKMIHKISSTKISSISQISIKESLLDIFYLNECLYIILVDEEEKKCHFFKFIENSLGIELNMSIYLTFPKHIKIKCIKFYCESNNIYLKMYIINKGSLVLITGSLEEIIKNKNYFFSLKKKKKNVLIEKERVEGKTLEEILQEKMIIDISAMNKKSVPLQIVDKKQLNAGTMVETIKQALNSNDGNLLAQLIRFCPSHALSDTIRIMDHESVEKLLEFIVKVVENYSNKLPELLTWLKTILISHGDEFMQKSVVGNSTCQSLKKIIEERVLHYNELQKLSGQLDLLIETKQERREENLVSLVEIDEEMLESELSELLDE